MPCAESTLMELSQYYDIKIVSHGFSPNLKQKEIWIKKRLPYAEFIGVNLKKYTDKSHVDMSDGVFIDDNMKNLITSNASENVCFGRICGWNKDWEGIRLNDWLAVKQYFISKLNT